MQEVVSLSYYLCLTQFFDACLCIAKLAHDFIGMLAESLRPVPRLKRRLGKLHYGADLPGFAHNRMWQFGNHPACYQVGVADYLLGRVNRGYAGILLAQYL